MTGAHSNSFSTILAKVSKQYFTTNKNDIAYFLYFDIPKSMNNDLILELLFSYCSVIQKCTIKCINKNLYNLHIDKFTLRIYMLFFDLMRIKCSDTNTKRKNSWNRRLHHENDPLPLFVSFT